MSQNPPSSPPLPLEDDVTSTPRPRQATNNSNNLASSPLFYRSSSPVHGVADSSQSNGFGGESNSLDRTSQDIPVDMSSPFGPMSHSQSSLPSQPTAANAGHLPSSPMRTPRASGSSHVLLGDSSPIRYDASSSPTRGPGSSSFPHHPSQRLHSDLRSDSSGLFVSSASSGPRQRRGDINTDVARTPRAPRRVMVDDTGRVVTTAGGTDAPVGPTSDIPSFANRDVGTSEADALGGNDQSLIWGTTVSIDDTFNRFKDFLRHFTRKYRLYRDGLTEAQVLEDAHADAKPYWESLQNMLLLGTTRLYLDVSDLKLYPPTLKLWHQIQAYPQEIVPIMDQSVHDLMIEVAREEDWKQRQQQQQQNGTGHHGSDIPPLSSDRMEAATPSATPSSSRPTDPQQQTSLEDQVAQSVYVVRPFGLDETINLRNLNPNDMDRLISIKGLVIRATPVIPDMKDAFFRCTACHHSVNVGLDRGKIREPTECPRAVCATKNSMQIVHNRCSFEDKQVIKLQETPDAVPAGQTPHSVSVCVYNELVDFCKAGDRVQLTGIYRVSPVRVNPRQRNVKSVYKTYVDVLHIQKVDKKRLGADPSTLTLENEEQLMGGDEDDEDGDEEVMTKDGGDGNHMEQTRKITPEEEAKIRATAQRADIYDLLSRSLAPSIYEMDDVKKGILLQLFGGTNKSFQKGGNPKYRGDINVLLCGDPSTSKSQILSYVHKIAPRGVYTSGKGSSAVGLTAYVTRDPETRQLVLESGALVLSDGGVCCIDEFDKMSDATRSVLHEVMEQQTVSVAKAGIITTLNARTSILASANPIGSRYNPDLPVPQNIDLPPTLLSRFDLVYLILDRVDEKTDRRLAKHLLSMYIEDSPDHAPTGHEILPVEFLTSYISYAKSRIHPTISPEAGEELVAAYVEMRKLGQDVRAAEKRITATTRQLESMIRLSEAHAKMRLATTVTRDDVREAYRLIRTALKTAATDAQGRIDMSLLTEGTSAAERRQKEDMKRAVLALLDELTASGASVRYATAMQKLAEGQGVPVEASDFGECMRALELEGAVTIVGEGARRSIRRVTGVMP